MNIQEIRQKYPQYSDLSDEQLAKGLHGKFYADMPFDEFAGKIGLKAQAPAATYDPTEGMSGAETFLAGAGKAFADIGRGARQMLAGSPDINPEVFAGPHKTMAPGPERDAALERIRQERQASISGIQSEIDEARRLDAPLKNTTAGAVGNVVGNVAAALPASLIPGANTMVGSALIGGGLGALQPTVEGESRLMNTGLGAGFGAAGFGVGKLANKAVSSAASRVKSIEAKVAAKAAADAASETASARSAAGNAAQNAYRQLEHLRELNAMGLLTPEQKLIAKGLEKELAGKAAEKLLPAAAQKEATAKAFKELTENETERAVKLAIERLSNKEIKSQAMARLKRYGPAALGGMVGNVLFPGLGGMVGGAAAGLTLRPAFRSMVNLAKNPAVQHRLLSPIAGAGLLGNPAVPEALGLLGSSIYASQQ